MGGEVGCHTWAWWLVPVTPSPHVPRRMHAHTRIQACTLTHTNTHAHNPQVNDTDMKDICYPPPPIPSEIIRQWCATWFIFPSPTCVHWPTVPPDVCPAAPVALPSLSVRVCVFWHKLPIFQAAQRIREQGHRYSAVQRIAASIQPYLYPCTLCSPSLSPLVAPGHSHYFQGTKTERILSGTAPPFSSLTLSLLRIWSERHRKSVWKREIGGDDGAWWGVNGVRWQTGVGNWGGGSREARDLTQVGMRMGWLLSWRRVAVETAPFFQTDRQASRQEGTWGLTAECVNMKRVCGYERVATTPTHTHTILQGAVPKSCWFCRRNKKRRKGKWFDFKSYPQHKRQ